MKKQTLRILRLMETEETAKLAKTVLVKDIQCDGARELIGALYKESDPLKNKVATILNAMFTQQRITFLLSKGLANTLILEDPNHTFKGVNSETYKMIVHKLLTGWGFFIRLREPTRKQAGVLKLVDKDLLDMMYRLKGKEYYAAQEIVTLELYDGYKEDDKAKDEGPKILSKKEIAEMKGESFEDRLIESATEALAHAKGEKELKTTLVKLKEKKHGKGKKIF